MQSSARSRRRLLVLLLGLATISLYLWSKMMTAVPLDIPLSLSTGHIQSPEFKTAAAIRYDIDIAFDSGIPHEELNCLIGMNIVSIQPCTNQPSILKVNWKLVHDDQTVANGSSTEIVSASYSSDKTARRIGYFDAGIEKKYKLELDVLEDATRLAQANPKLVVEPFLNAYEGWLMLAGLGFYVGIFFTVLGIVIIVTSAIREGRLRNKLAII